MKILIENTKCLSIKRLRSVAKKTIGVGLGAEIVKVPLMILVIKSTCFGVRPGGTQAYSSRTAKPESSSEIGNEFELNFDELP